MEGAGGANHGLRVVAFGSAFAAAWSMQPLWKVYTAASAGLGFADMQNPSIVHDPIVR